MNHKSRSNHQLTKLKVALAAGGLMATLAGASLLGRDASTSGSSVSITTEPAITADPESAGTASIDASIPAGIDLNLEAVPTVAAPTFRSAPVTMGRSSG